MADRADNDGITTRRKVAAKANPPSRHHYVPEFLLRQWAGTDGKLERFAIEHDGIRSRRVSPSSVGWSRDLYRLKTEPDPWRAQALEWAFFARIDDLAARCLARLLRGELNDLPDLERQGWVMFIRSLFHRSPHAFAELTAKLVAAQNERLPGLIAEYSELVGQDHPEAFSDWWDSLPADHVQRRAYQLMIDLIGGEKIGRMLVEARWGVVNVRDADHLLVVSDAKPAVRPLLLPMGHIAIPIAPTKLFVVAMKPDIFALLKREPAKRLVRAVNRWTVQQARSFVGAADTASSDYITKHFATGATQR